MGCLPIGLQGQVPGLGLQYIALGTLFDPEHRHSHFQQNHPRSRRGRHKVWTSPVVFLPCTAEGIPSLCLLQPCPPHVSSGRDPAPPSLVLPSLVVFPPCQTPRAPAPSANSGGSPGLPDADQIPCSSAGRWPGWDLSRRGSSCLPSLFLSAQLLGTATLSVHACLGLRHRTQGSTGPSPVCIP